MFKPDPDVIRWGLDALFVNPHSKKISDQTSTAYHSGEHAGEENGNGPEVDSVIYPDPGENYSGAECSSDLEYDFSLDGEVGKRLNQITPTPHIPKIHGEIPTDDEAISDHERLLERLNLYDLVELKVEGDGNCQFRALSDQIYRTAEHHVFVRKAVVCQLKFHREIYEAYVPMAYEDYLKKLSREGEWGDHVTLQAAADSYGLKIFVLTSFKDTCYIEIQPHVLRSRRVIFLSFWAEVHYNSIYPEGEYPIPELKPKKTRRFWRRH